MTGTWMDESLGVYVGWVARKGSFSDGMPLRNERGDVVLRFPARSFRSPDTIQRLRGRGHEFDEAGPPISCTSTKKTCIPRGIEWQISRSFDGRTHGTATLFNDRYGMHRIYYHESKDAFYFAAEAKPSSPSALSSGEWIRRGLGEFVSCGAVLENRTLFEGIQVLPPSVRLDISQRLAGEKDNYFHPTRMGGPGDTGAGILLPGTSECVHAKSSAVFQRPRSESPCP